MKIIEVMGVKVSILGMGEKDFISLTDLARAKSYSETDDIIKNWMRNRSTIEFLGLWEKVNNPNFKPVEFDGFKNDSGNNTFVMTPSKWVTNTGATGIFSKSGRYGGGTYAHKDIAIEFASWISSEFKLYLIKEFQRLKADENGRLALGWDLKRTLTKINYKIHTDAIKEYIVPKLLTTDSNVVYASEADVLNVALFGKTAKEWRDQNPKKDGNIRDYATVEQLVILTNLESLNAELIKQNLPQHQRLLMLNKTAIDQTKSLLGNSSVKKLKKGEL